MSSGSFAVITGAGAGLGKAFAEELAHRKHNVILVSLPGEGLDAFSKQIISKYGVQADYYEVDLTQDGAPEKFVAWVNSKGYDVNILVNNAGLGDHGKFEETSHAFNSTILKLNVVGTYSLVHLFLPLLKKHKRSWIMNVGSMAGVTPTPYKAVYSATKSFIYNFSQSLHYELRHSGIVVSCVAPGGIITNEKVRARIQAAGWLGRRNAMLPEDVARISIRKMFAGKSLIIPGFSSNLGYYLFKFLPSWLTLNGLEKRLRKSSKG